MEVLDKKSNKHTQFNLKHTTIEKDIIERILNQIVLNY